MTPPLPSRSPAIALTLVAGVGAISWGAAPAQSWPPLQPRGYVALQQAVVDARTDLHYLVVASHPDDRYVMPATWLRNERGYRVSALLLTRGDGGQNSRGPETGDALGRIRTLETEACAARLGFDVWYLNAPDRGYCRTAAEALAEWGFERTVRSMALLLRRIRPDVVLTTHHSAEGHGHDLALLEMLPEAVRRACDPEYEPGHGDPADIARLFLGVEPSLHPPEGAEVLDMEIMDGARGMTYRRLAYEALTEEHASQSPYPPMEQLFRPTVVLRPVPIGDGEEDSGLVPRGRGLFHSLPEWLADDRVDDLRYGFDRRLEGLLAQPVQLLPEALELWDRLDEIPAEPSSELALRIARRVDALQRIVLHAAAIHCDVEVEDGQVAVPGEDLPLTIRIHKGDPAALENIELRGLGGAEVSLLGDGEGPLVLPAHEHTLEVAAVYQVPPSWGDEAGPISRPYRQDRFVPPVRLEFRCRIRGRGIAFPIALAQHDSRPAPLEVRPPIELEPVPAKILLPKDRRRASFNVMVRRNTRHVIEGELQIKGPPGTVVRGQPEVRITFKHSELFPFELGVPEQGGAPVSVLRAGLGSQTEPIPVHRVDVEVPGDLHVGLVKGVDDATHAVLRGLLERPPVLLNRENLLLDDLSVFDTIVVDVRAFRDAPVRQAAFPRLLDFCAGPHRRLVVFYHKDAEFNPEQSGFLGAPHQPFRIGKGRVTQADAPVRVLVSSHPLLNRPNRIVAEDWDGWEQERGLYFPETYGPEYVELLAMNDPGRPEERGALLYTEVGDGEYVYCALSLYRQLKKLHPGGVRLFANLITPTRP